MTNKYHSLISFSSSSASSIVHDIRLFRWTIKFHHDRCRHRQITQHTVHPIQVRFSEYALSDEYHDGRIDLKRKHLFRGGLSLRSVPQCSQSDSSFSDKRCSQSGILRLFLSPTALLLSSTHPSPPISLERRTMNVVLKKTVVFVIGSVTFDRSIGWKFSVQNVEGSARCLKNPIDSDEYISECVDASVHHSRRSDIAVFKFT